MSERYNHKAIEKKWQKRWEESQIYRTQEDASKPKIYVLDMFPYPSGEGLHVGHPKGYIATDIYSRFKRMQGNSVLHPMGWDAFGLPAENYALKNKIHPRIAVEKNIAYFKKQLEEIGFDYDWSREINTTDPTYYRWTQWIFLQLYKKGLAYQSNEPINWCPSCMTGLANEDLNGNVCERCDSVVEKKKLSQWVLKITEYADRILKDLDLLQWPEHIKEAQRNWIGRSEGAEIDFSIANSNEKIKVFTTRPDTIFGATYMVLAPEHPLIPILKSKIENWDEVIRYVSEASAKTEMDRTKEGKEKTGIQLKGVEAINPANQEKIPIFVADYVLGGYGTGAIMAVPAYDDRDREFAKNFNLPSREIVPDHETWKQFGTKKTTYKLKDWVFSRQRYWGEPIPIIHCPTHGAVAVPEDQLPVLLPEVESYEPSGTGESPLANIVDWVHTTCPICGGSAKRETNTMPQWAGSSWYYLRFMDPNNDDALVGKDKEKYWAPVDVYVGGDHAVRHLIYARFWHKFLYDLGVVSTVEPFARLEFLGFILAEDGKKMSKRLGNVINPTDVIATYGADSFRLYEMFMGPFENTVAWSTASIAGTTRFIERVWRLAEQPRSEETATPELEAILHTTAKNVGQDIEAFKFNTAVSQMMICLNAMEKVDGIRAGQWKAFVRLLAPFAPHIAEELWERLGEPYSVHQASWPQFDVSKMTSGKNKVAIQVNGKIRSTFELSSEIDEGGALALARANPVIAKWLGRGRELKAIYVPNKIISFVVESPLP
jgi:leucyl-tRNA synthetase